MNTISESKFRAHISKLTQIPEGFTTKWTTEKVWENSSNSETFLRFAVINKELGIEIWFDQWGSGHTNFDVVEDRFHCKTYKTFDLRGVEDSFYHLPLWEGDRTRYNLNRILKEQLERIEKQNAYTKTALSVPGIPFTVAPNKLPELKKQLKQGKSISFIPGEFGTGYVIYPRRVRFAKPASAALEKFFGVHGLSIESVECD